MGTNMAVEGKVFDALRSGLVIPACPLALNSARKLDERRQRALVRYYIAAGAGGVAGGVHRTQFGIRSEQIGLFQPAVGMRAAELNRAGQKLERGGGIRGKRRQ